MGVVWERMLVERELLALPEFSEVLEPLEPLELFEALAFSGGLALSRSSSFFSFSWGSAI